MSRFSSTSYDETWYTEHRDAGLDYAVFGHWQQSYAKMIADATLQQTYEAPSVFDAGCACGANLAGFRETGLFTSLRGIDISPYMVALGQNQFGFTQDELSAGSVTALPAESNSVSLLHSNQVLEHLPPEIIDQTLDEMVRVVRPGGRIWACLDAVKDGETAEKYLEEPTHLNIQPVAYWIRKFAERGVMVDVEAFERFARSPYGPTMGDDRNFFQIYIYWTVFPLIKL